MCIRRRGAVQHVQQESWVKSPPRKIRPLVSSPSVSDEAEIDPAEVANELLDLAIDLMEFHDDGGGRPARRPDQHCSGLRHLYP